LLAVLFFWGVYVWKDKSEREIVQQKAEAERLSATRRIEATKPFLERQLKLYTEASQVVAIIATTSNNAARSKAVNRFWELYWGELALVENTEVEAAMVAFGEGLKKDAPLGELQQLSLTLAHACRFSLDKSWGIHAWSEPDKAAH
jgi:hypothetical protein